MKKTILNVAALSIAASLLLTSCLSTGSVDKEKMDEVSGGLYLKEVSNGMVENATPENSVLVYGYIAEPDSKLWYADEKSDWEATINNSGREIILPPVNKGASLVLKRGGFFKHEVSVYNGANWRRVNETVDTWYEIDNDEFNVKVPSNKSLCFIGFHSILMPGANTFEGMQTAWAKYKEENLVIGGVYKTQEDYDKGMKKIEINVLKKLLKQYKGTEWESVINERITELNS